MRAISPAESGFLQRYPVSRVDYTIDFDGNPPGFVFTSSGAADLATMLQAQEELFAHPRFRAGIPMLFDHSALDTRSLSAADVKRVGEAYRQFLERVGESPVAIVVAHPAAFGLVRMAGAHSGAPAPNVAVFYSRAEALEWLRTLALP
jgi:hypothetical protein